MSTENECIQLKPSPLCGYKGTCLNTTRCVCESGWSKSTEMAVYLNGDLSTINDENLVCDTNETLLTLLYGISLVGFMWAIYKHANRIKKRKHAIRLVPLLSAYCCGIVSVCIRFSVTNSYLGQDAVFTFFYSLSWFLANTSSLIFYNRFVIYQAKSSHVAKLSGTSSRINLKILKRAQYIVLVVDVVIWSLVLSTGFIESFHQDKRILTIAFSIYVFRNLYAAWADIYYVGVLINDCRVVLQNSMSIEDDRVAQIRVADDALAENLKTRTIPNYLYLRNIVVSFNMFIILFHALPLLWDLWWNIYKYFIPTGFLMGTIMNVEVIAATARTKGVATNSKGERSNKSRSKGKLSTSSFGELESTLYFPPTHADMEHSI